MKLERYAAAARRDWRKSLAAIRNLRAADRLSSERESRTERNLTEAAINSTLAAPLPGRHGGPVLTTPAPALKCETKPLPAPRA